MIVQLSRDIGDYLYDVFVARFDMWLVFGLVAQFMFAMRFIVQWIESEKVGRSTIPIAFWFFSIGGGLLTLAYGFVRRDAIIILGQALSLLIYARNLALIAKERRRAKADGGEPGRD